MPSLITRLFLLTMEALSMVALALPLLFFGALYLLSFALGSALPFLLISCWGGVELLVLAFTAGGEGRRALFGSGRRLAFGVVAALALLALLQDPGTDKGYWAKTYWFLLGLVPLAGSLLYRVTVAKKEQNGT